MSLLLDLTRIFVDSTCHNDVLHWGSDGTIAFATVSGIVTVIPQLIARSSDQCLLFSRIAIDKEVLQLCSDKEKYRVLDLIEKATERQPSPSSQVAAAHIFYDRTLSPCLIGANSYCGMRLVRFSCLGADEFGRCVLATLSVDHRLVIFSRGRSRDKWKQVADLSIAWKAHMRKEKHALAKRDGNADTGHLASQLINKTYPLAALCMAWSHCLCSRETGESCAVLLAAMRSGHIAVWKLVCPIVNESCFEVLNLIDILPSIPMSLRWCELDDNSGMVVVGYQDGTLHSFIISQQHDGSFQYGQPTDIWKDKDNIPVTVLEWDKKRHMLFAGKGPYLLVFEVQAKIRSLSVSVLRTNHTDVKSSHFINGLGLCRNGVFVSTLNNQTFEVTIDKESGLKLECRELETLVAEGETASSGLASSPNGTLITQISTRRYDSSLRKDTSLELRISSTQDLEEIATFLLCLPDDSSLFRVRDALLVLMHAVYFGASPLPAPLQGLKGATKSWHNLNMFRIKLLRFLIFMDIQHKNTQLDQEKNLETLEHLILRKNAVEFLKRAVELHEAAKLPEDEKAALKPICRWMQCRGDKADDEKVLKYQETLELPVESALETCTLCQSEFIKRGSSWAECANGHKFGLCCHTLAVCMDPVSRHCTECNSKAMTLSKLQYSWLSQSQILRCVFCDEPLS